MTEGECVVDLNVMRSHSGTSAGVTVAVWLAIGLTAVSAGCASPGRGPLTLIHYGKVHATIVVADNAAKQVMRAAETFQKIAKQMTGASVPIRKESAFDGSSIPVLVGMSEAARRYGVAVRQDPRLPDHYVIRSAAGYLALIGNDAHEFRASIYAVYDFFERLGCGWYGPDPLWRVIQKRKVLRVGRLNVDERPAFLHRRIWMHRMPSQELRDAWRQGGRSLRAYHNHKRLIPRQKHQKDHADWFGPKQLCLTHPEVIRRIAAQFAAQIDKLPPRVVRSFSLSANDCGGFCRCDRCAAVGNVSARMVCFANEIARELDKTHAGRFILTSLAYWFTHGPPRPMIQAHPAVCIMLVNEGNHAKPLEEPEPPQIARKGRCNTRELRAFHGWQKTGGLRAIYEWWIPVIGSKVWRDIPWYSGETALRNLRFWQQGGVRYVFYESQRERNGGFPLRWPLYYVGARGLWNPELTARQIMNEACRKLYGRAAEPMRNYYEALERAMYTPEIEARASAHLARAAPMADDEPARKRIRVETRLWQTARKALAHIRQDGK